MSEASAPPFIRQQALVESIASTAVSRVDGEWSSVTVELRCLAPWSQYQTLVTRPDGSVQSISARGIGDDAHELRDVMYRDGAGTWFSGTIVIDTAGHVSATFDYDNEPAWSRPAEPIFYAQDLGKYPRDESAIPAWLRAQLELAPSDL